MRIGFFLEKKYTHKHSHRYRYTHTHIEIKTRTFRQVAAPRHLARSAEEAILYLPILYLPHHSKIRLGLHDSSALDWAILRVLRGSGCIRQQKRPAILSCVLQTTTTLESSLYTHTHTLAFTGTLHHTQANKNFYLKQYT